MSANIITDILPFDYEPVELGHDRKVALRTGSTSGFPVSHSRLSTGVDVDVSATLTAWEDTLNIDNFRTLVGHHAMLWYAPTFSDLPSSSSETPRGLASGYSSYETLFEIACAKMDIADLVRAVNPKARFSVSERGDVITMRAENWAARNMFRAHSGLIRAKMTKDLGTAVPVGAAELDS